MVSSNIVYVGCLIQRVLHESHTEASLDQLEQDVNEALTLLERDLPVSKDVGQQVVS